jgi:hypothetical protein
MFRRSRLTRVSLALALLAGLWAGPLGPGGLSHLAENDDTACAVPAPPDGAPRTIQAGDGAGAPLDEHCATCHWLCSLRWQAPPAFVVVFGISAAGALPDAAPLSDLFARPFSEPARAPPVAA